MTGSTQHPGGLGRLGDRTVARIGYGAMQLEAAGRRITRDEAIAVVRRAVELGVDHIDTAEFYGDGTVNAILRDALTPADGVAIVSKVGAIRAEGSTPPLVVAQKPHEIREQVEQNLRTLGVDRLDVVNMRRTDGGMGVIATGDQVVPLDDQLAELADLREAGKIGAIGLSNVDAGQLRSALAAGIVCVQNAYNPLHREDEDVLDLCIAEGIAWVPYVPLGSAFERMPTVADRPEIIAIAERLGATPTQVGLAWHLARTDRTLLIPGTASIAHLEENLGAGDVVLDAAALAEIEALAAV